MPGSAAMEWTRNRFTQGFAFAAFNFFVGSPFALPDGSTSVPAAFSARTWPQIVANGDVQKDFIKLVSAVGYKDLKFGPDLGRAIESNNELLIPGPLAMSFDGSRFVEDGFCLPPTQPIAVGSNSGGFGHLPQNARLSYVVVFTSLNRNGDRVMSAPSLEVIVQLTSPGGFAQDTVTLTGLMLHQTLRPDVQIAIYRNTFLNGVPSTIHYRVDSPLSPILNDPNQVEWTFVDQSADQDVLAAEALYTDQNYLPRDPAPAFSVGTTMDGRDFVLADDNSIQYSAAATEGEALWWSSGAMRIQPFTSEPIKAIVGLDHRLICITPRSIWQQDVSQLAQPDGSGANVQPAVRLPFSTGGSGPCALTDVGIVYAGSDNSLYLIDRALTIQKISGPVDADVSTRTATDIVVSSDQRLRVGFGRESQGTWGSGTVWGGGTLWGGPQIGFHAVYDLQAGAWSIDRTPSAPLRMALLAGQTVYLDSFGAMAADSSRTTDDGIDGNPQFIVSRVGLMPFLFQGIQRFQRVWEFQVRGTSLGTAHVTMVAKYDEATSDSPLSETWEWDIDSTDVLKFDFQPKVEQIETLSLELTTSFPDPAATGAALALEAFSFLVGVMPGLPPVRVATKRIQSNG